MRGAISITIERLVLDAPVAALETGRARADFAKLLAAALQNLIATRGAPPGLATMGAVARLSGPAVSLDGPLSSIAQALAESLYAGLAA
jgi:hypothetical protein